MPQACRARRRHKMLGAHGELSGCCAICGACAVQLHTGLLELPNHRSGSHWYDLLTSTRAATVLRTLKVSVGSEPHTCLASQLASSREGSIRN